VTFEQALALLAAIGGLAAFVTACGTVYIGIRNSRKADEAKIAAAVAAKAATDATAAIVRTENGVFQLGERVNGRLTKLLATTEAMARAEGHASGVQDEQTRTRGPEA
jgi:hypothetical protein